MCQVDVWSSNYDHLRSLGRSIARSFDRSVARSLDRSIDRSIARSIERSLDRSIARSIAQSLDRSIARSLNRSIDRSLDRSVARSLVRSVLIVCRLVLNWALCRHLYFTGLMFILGWFGLCVNSCFVVVGHPDLVQA